jgi:hypothetical protein
LFQLTDYSPLEKAHHEHLQIDNPSLVSDLVEQRFIGMNPAASISGLEPRAHTYNFFLGKDQSKWASSVSAFQEVSYQNCYPGINLNWQFESGHYKYAFIVSPGAQVNQIQWKYTGAQQVSVKKGVLYLKTTIGEIREERPYAYQEMNGQRKEITCTYRQQDNGTFQY